MNFHSLNLFNTIQNNYDATQYFWYMLPYAVPGFLTFIIGFSLSILGIIRIKRKERLGYYLSFSGSCLGFGMLGLILALRSVIQNQEFLLEINTQLYSFVLLLAPSSSHLIYYILDKKYPYLLFGAGLNWLVSMIAFIGILKGSAFTGEFLIYSFGKYPVASMYLKPWGAVGAITFFLMGVPAYYLYLRQNSFREKRFLVIGHTSLLLLIISNLPSFIGIPIFPGSTFSFIPMCILAYGIFNSDFKDFKELLFEKNGLFYVMNVLVGIILLALAVIVLFYLSPSDYANINWYPWLLIPLFSFFLVIGLGIFIGGTNPDRQLNQLGAFSLYLYGIQLLAIIAMGFCKDSLIGHRIEQVCYIFFCFVASIQFRFAYICLNKPLPRVTLFLDIASVILSLMAMSPYLFIGYYEFYWGRISASGPVIQILGLVGSIAIAVALKEWWELRKENKENTLGNFAIFYFAVGGLMLMGNLPATIGLEIYPVGNLSILPTGILAFAVIKYGGENIKTESLRISSYLVPFAVFVVVFLLFFIWNKLPKDANVSDRYFHILLSGIPILLLSFLSTFVLIRPIASEVDLTLRNLKEAMELTERQKEEIEIISDYSKKLNSNLNLDIILDQIFHYFEERYNIEAIIIQFLDKEKNEFYSYKTTSPENATTEMIGFSRTLRLPFDERIGILYQAYKKTRTLYLPRLNINLQPPLIYDMIKKLNFKSFLFVPLVVQDEILGSMFFTSYREPLKLTKTDISNISIFCNQISTSLQNSRLFKQANEAQKDAEIEKGIAIIAKSEAEKAKQDIEYLNDFSKLINAVNDLDKVFAFTVDHLKDRYAADIFLLQLVNRKKSELIYRCVSFPDEVTEEQAKRHYSAKLPIKEGGGSYYITYSRKRTLYLKDIKRITLDDFSNFDKDAIEDLKLNSLLQVPLLVKNEVIGIIHINQYGGMRKLSKADLSFIESFCEQLAIAVHNASLYQEADNERKKSESLLLNILPKDVASELKEKGAADPVQFESVSVLFTDFKGFTSIAESMSPNDLVKELDACFVQFDRITERHNLEKLKTIGDSYMCAGGIPKINKTNAVDSVLAAIEIQNFMNMVKSLKEEKGLPYWELRLGIHTGPLVAGVIGERKFAYDVWGDTVNTASRMESSGTPGKINISGTTYEAIKGLFECEYRGRINAKNKGDIDMYYVNGIKKELSKEGEGKIPNGLFWKKVSLSQEKI